MKIDAAKDLLETVFASSYSRDNFKRLAAEVFNRYDRKEQTIYEEGIKNFTNLGLFEDDKGKKIAIFEVELLSENSLHRARVKQRNLIANQLKIHDYESALCSFYHANQGEWRLSFITRESSIDVSTEKLKFIEQLSPSRRQSFIAGPNEGIHTAKKQFLPRIQSDNNPSFDEIASIFEIEAVNDDFYEQYKELYLSLTEELEQFMEKDPVIAADFKEKEVSASDFAKKTLGQFVFLYFLQRKGWIKDKAHPDDRFSFSKLFDDRKKFGDNFFNDVMEPIFYESLAKKEPNLEVYSVLHHYEFPYLNGGLFEPIRDYDWEKTNIVISDTFFKNDNRSKDGDIGDGLLDVFNRFNFTVHENDSLDQDIAVDPEMLGKVFENLLDIKDRKSKGAFYTPREIVQYMCQESLINYLDTEIGDEISSEALKLFITNHSILEAEDIKGPELEIIVENAIDLDQILANVKVCDPAVGSGAFPMGMLSEIVSARYSLQPFLPNEQTIYDLKLHTIGQSLYGVDLDPSAVDIARLRFWLSLIIEEDTPTPLPNLEHKLMQGNSLLSSYEGVELFNDQFLVNEDSRQEKLKILDGEIKTYEDELKNGVNTNDIQRVRAIKKHLISLGKQKNKIQAENITSPTTQMLFETDDALSRINKQVDLLQSKIKQFLLLDENSNKEDLKNEIENIKWDLIEASVDNESKARAFQQLKNKRIQPFFLWKLEFIDVFRNNNGFDIVIGNPPYIQLQKTINKISKTKLGDLYERSKYETFNKTGDIYALFYECGIRLTRDAGYLCFITSNKWMRAGYGKKLREFFYKKNPVKIIDLGKDIFKTATVDTNILIIQNKKNNMNTLGLNLIGKNLKKIRTDSFHILKNLDSENWVIESLIEKEISTLILLKSIKIEETDIKINRGIVTGANNAFIIDEHTRQNIIKENEECKDLIKPFILGRNLKKYSFNNENKFLLMTGYDIDIPNNYSEIYNYLCSFEKEALQKIKSRGDKGKNWYNLRACTFYNLFEKDKIAWGNISYNSSFSIVEKGIYVNAPANFLITDKYNIYFLLGIMNSSLFNYMFKKVGIFLGNAYEWKKQYIEKIPIPSKKYFDQEFENKLASLALNICDSRDLKQKELLSDEIDSILFDFYKINDDQAQIIKNSVS